MICLSVFSFFF